MDALATLQALARGRLFDDLCEAMMVVAEDVINTGRKGKVTLNLTIAQASPGEPSVIVVEEIKRTPPKKDPLGAILFIGDREFHRRDPRQPEMDFRVLEATPDEVRTPVQTETTVRGA
jgi:hypothetical protein